MTKKQEKMYDVLVELTTEQAINALLDWHGEQLLDDAFMQHLIDEGYTEDVDSAFDNLAEENYVISFVR